MLWAAKVAYHERNEDVGKNAGGRKKKQQRTQGWEIHGRAESWKYSKCKVVTGLNPEKYFPDWAGC